MNVLKIIAFATFLICLVSCFKKDICECNTYDSDGNFLFLISTPDEPCSCNSNEKIITSSGDTNTKICGIVRR